MNYRSKLAFAHSTKHSLLLALLWLLSRALLFLFTSLSRERYLASLVFVVGEIKGLQPEYIHSAEIVPVILSVTLVLDVSSERQAKRTTYYRTSTLTVPALQFNWLRSSSSLLAKILKWKSLHTLQQ